MKDEKKTKAQLLKELEELRRRVQESEALAREHLRLEMALQDDQSFIEYALDSLKDIFYFVGTDARLLRWNKTLREKTGYSDEELSSMTVFDFLKERIYRNKRTSIRFCSRKDRPG